MPSPKALPSQLNSAGRAPFASNEGLVISNRPLDDELLEDELLEDEELLELDEELLEEELLELEDELPVPPQLAMAADNNVRLHAKTILFMVVS